MKKAFVTVLLIGIFLIGGCVKQQPTTAFIGGNEGLVASFIDLPSTIFSTSLFDIKVLLQNKGEADVPANAAKLTLNNAGTFGVDLTNASLSNTQRLEKAKKINNTILSGGINTIIWQGASFKGAVITEQQTIPISVSVCYPYETTGIVLACAGKTDKVCKPAEEKPIQSSGAPIQITNFRQIATPKGKGIEFAFVIDVENKGGGDVYNAGCENLLLEQKDVVTINSVIFDNKEVNADCKNQEISLWQNKGSISCKFDISELNQDYNAELVVKLNYTYKSMLNSAITVIPA
jgi:hypothetical protein